MPSEGALLLSKFGWGSHFPEVNSELIARYQRCMSSKQVEQEAESMVANAQLERERERKAWAGE